ncbi:hypothetical protein N1851_018708 [Merluccius polli]|uniref:Uncharacterized protein n=1 Tax=Merluccius polli TaxID=89951 RepID=A0AA47MNA3_MERPO|nr:hypothetical protein N1851_018708 [Merluccius polli]
MSSKDGLINKLSGSMDNRFQDVSSGVLGVIKVVDFKKWHDAENSSEVEKLLRQFESILTSSGINVGQMQDQSTILKTRHKDPGNMFWPEVQGMQRAHCPDIWDLVDLILCLPTSTAKCEHGFSIMKQVQLSSLSIKDLDPSRAIKMWHADTIRSRRPDYI